MFLPTLPYQLPFTGWELFNGWFENKNCGVLVGNPWNLDMGKLIVENVYKGIDSLKVVATNYDLVTRIVMDFDGVNMVKVTREEIAHVFKLTEWSEDMVQIDQKVLIAEYEKTKHSFKAHILPKYLTTTEGQKVILGPFDKDPYPISYFVPHFQNNFYSICQITGYDPVTSMPMAWMNMATHIQHPHYCIVYDYGGFLAEKIHEGLVRLKKGEVGVKFVFIVYAHVFV